MIIDWFTVGAQALNFLILVYLLKRFLYHPILQAIDAREKVIADKIAAAEQLKTAAEKQQNALQQQQQAFAAEKQTRLQQAIAEAEKQHAVLLTDAKQQVALLRQQAIADLDQEIHTLHTQIAEESLQQIYANSAKVLQDLAGIALQQRMFEVFIARLKHILAEPPAADVTEQQTALLNHLKQPAVAVTLRSAEPLSPEQQNSITTCLTALIPDTNEQRSPITFVVATDLICGIELVMEGWKLSWSSENYLASLQASGQALSALLPEKAAQPAAKRALPMPSEPNNDGN